MPRTSVPISASVRFDGYPPPLFRLALYARELGSDRIEWPDALEAVNEARILEGLPPEGPTWAPGVLLDAYEESASDIIDHIARGAVARHNGDAWHATFFTTFEAARFGGDLQIARAVRRALRAAGHPIPFESLAPAIQSGRWAQSEVDVPGPTPPAYQVCAR